MSHIYKIIAAVNNITITTCGYVYIQNYSSELKVEVTCIVHKLIYTYTIIAAIIY